ncbi:hypothetical protein ACFFJY_12010 [Fictibacillus aquaticus]|uniref:Uncharacterized protein n=1 Tax=Fictibacillus aquaticus TaxID=2021314 RepID=A0A235FC69_9BACL|nr:hypothetical protein [Fictibacillus aquaticus]OYD58970.1 hypothetical protein CGZ90_03450 [Fictibacillus aquaticus]
MELDLVWDSFLQSINRKETGLSAYKKEVTGIPFLYVSLRLDTADRKQAEQIIKLCAAKAIKGKRLRIVMEYVREEIDLLVYRFRFLVPQEKMFCCGNLCPDCIRFKNPY